MAVIKPRKLRHKGHFEHIGPAASQPVQPVLKSMLYAVRGRDQPLNRILAKVLSPVRSGSRVTQRAALGDQHRGVGFEYIGQCRIDMMKLWFLQGPAVQCLQRMRERAAQ